MNKVSAEHKAEVRERNLREWKAKNREHWSKHNPYTSQAEKKCAHCKKSQDKHSFAKALDAKDGLQAWCNTCIRDRNTKNPARQMLINARRRAHEKGLLFDLSEKDIQVPIKCPILGIPLVVGKKQSPNSPSLDRKDSSKGYTKENIAVISWRANDLKKNATINELESLLVWMKENQC